ncbi:MAG: DUF3558 domain-containing protein [Nocardia sp.]|nr:DUF3558 domain-containing protein [Nocardia sp.]
MTKAKFAVGVAACVALTAAVTGCNNSSETAAPSASPPSATSAAGSATPARPTLTAAELQPPTQDESTAQSSGRPKVVFDPCTWVPDDVIDKAGFSAASRKRGQDQVAEQSFLTCDFKSTQRRLQIDSGNVTWDEDLQKYTQATQFTINGRQALWTNDQTFRNQCEIHLRTRVGFVRVAAILTDAVSVNDTSPCDGLQNTATLIEPTIGPDA